VALQVDASTSGQLEFTGERSSPLANRDQVIDPVLHTRVIFLMRRGEQQKAIAVVAEQMRLDRTAAREVVDWLWQQYQATDWSEHPDMVFREHGTRVWIAVLGAVAGLGWLIGHLVAR